MDLADHQRKLLGLARSTYRVCPEDDAYIHTVAQSKDLEEARRNIFLWRIYVLERSCVLTFTLLKQRHLLEEALSAFIARHNLSPFRETQGPAFLEALSGHHDDLIASVAGFELALMKVRQGDPCSYVVPWNVEPHRILTKIHTLERHETLRSQSPERVCQEIWGLAIGYNLVRLEIEHVARSIGLSPARISYRGALLLIRNFFLTSWLVSPGTLPTHLQRLHEELALLVLPKRRLRRYPRAVKFKSTAYPRKIRN